MDFRQRATELFAKAVKYRRLARLQTDRETASQILELTSALEQEVDQLAVMLHQQRIRTRAHQIWQEHRCPPGRDDEFWFQAERELGKLPEVDELKADLLLNSRSRS